MNKVIENLILKTKKAYKQSVIDDNELLQDMLLEILTDMKQLEEKESIKATTVEKIGMSHKKPRYTYEEVKAISEVQVKLAKDFISLDEAKREILSISDRFPVHNLVQYTKRLKNAFLGVGEYGFAFSSNWAKALLKVTNNNPMIIKALKEQQRLYREKDGRINETLEKLLNEL